tara:strand:- start:2435 stop:2674 length:240 start_codon:yes stop_codon:yes gene_type:complete
MMNKTLYKRLDEICAREHIVNKLSDNKYRTFVDLLYDDIRTWDEPMNVSEVDIIHRIGEHLSYMVSRSLADTYTGTNHD